MPIVHPDFSEATGIDTRLVLPGEYMMVIREPDPVDTSRSSAPIWWRPEVVEGDFQGATVLHITPTREKGAGIFADFLAPFRAVMSCQWEYSPTLKRDAPVAPDTDEVVGLYIRAHVSNEEYEGKMRAKLGPFVHVKGYQPDESVVPF